MKLRIGSWKRLGAVACFSLVAAAMLTGCGNDAPEKNVPPPTDAKGGPPGGVSQEDYGKKMMEMQKGGGGAAKK